MLSHIKTERVATSNGQQPTTKHTSRFAGNMPVILRMVWLDAMICESRRTLFMAPENELIVAIPWQVNSNANRWTASHFAVSKTACFIWNAHNVLLLNVQSSADAAI